MSKLSFLATLLASAAVGIQAQAPAQAELCSCSPTVFNFILDFSNGCTVNDIKGNPGVETSLCFQEEVPAVPGQPPSSSDPARRALQNPTDDDPVVEVVNAQFLEFDTKGDLTVINQDNTYNSTTLKDGAAMQFYSVSSMLDTSVPLADQMEKPALVPGGASLILYGKTASGKVIRNRFFWLYNMECGRDTNPVQVGDQIGWVKVEPDLGGAWPAFCAALPPGSPTISPRTNEPTLTPSASPIVTVPTIPPVSSLIPVPTTKGPTNPIFTSKSAKSKTHKPPPSSKSGKGGKTKGGKSKSSKGGGSKWSSLNANLIYQDLAMNGSSMFSSFGLSLIGSLAASFYFAGVL